MTEETVMKKYDEMSLKDYAKELSGDAPVPGGGSVAAYTATLAMGLTQMVGRITLNRKPKKDLSEEESLQEDAKKLRIKDLLEKLEKASQEALEVVSLDPRVYDEVMACYANKASAEEIEDALFNAFKLQADLALLILMAREWNETLKELSSGAVKNDLLVSEDLLNASYKGAYHTAHINVVYMKNEERKKHAEDALSQLKSRFEGGK